MAAPVCELCGATSFVKEDGMFTCQSCGTKYSPEEAQKLMRANAQADAGAQAQAATQHVADVQLDSTSDFRPQTLTVADQGARNVNNYICRGFQLLIDEYERIDHPDENRFEELVARARECVMILDTAAQLEPNNHEANLLLMNNCAEMERAVSHAKYYDKDEEGEWHSHSGFFTDLDIPGQKDSWDDKATYHRNFLEQQFVDIHTLDWQRKLELQQQINSLKVDLDELKDEKRSKGFFNFAEKREVKDRMRPVKDKISELERQVREIDDMVDDFVENKLAALGQTYTRLDF